MGKEVGVDERIILVVQGWLSTPRVGATRNGQDASTEPFATRWPSCHLCATWSDFTRTPSTPPSRPSWRYKPPSSGRLQVGIAQEGAQRKQGAPLRGRQWRTTAHNGSLNESGQEESRSRSISRPEAAALLSGFLGQFTTMIPCNQADSLLPDKLHVSKFVRCHDADTHPSPASSPSTIATPDKVAVPR